MGTGRSNTPEDGSKQITLYRQEIAGFKWVYNFDDRKAEETNFGKPQSSRRDPWIRKNLIEGDS